MENVRVRIGPSPTGEPHVGTAWITLFNLGFARSHGGKLVLRIEDTDQERSRPEWEQEIMAGLRWLGLSWDEGPDVGGPHGPYRQSERREIHRAHAEQLVRDGQAYRCFCTKERLDALRETQRANKDRLGYDGHCRDLDPAEIDARLTRQEPFTIRMKMPKTGDTVIHDRLRGDVTFSNENVDDQVLLKSDGFPTYHLANVVDDHLMEITHVIRAEEWISSTPKHVILYQMFGWTPPVFVHLPLLRNKDTSKISKRKNPVSIMDYKQRGFLPEAVVNFLGLLGWSMPDGREIFTLDEFLAAFSLDRVSLTGPIFDLEKLTWLNGKYFRERLTNDDVARLVTEQVFNPAYIKKIMPLVRERIDVGEQFIEATDYFFKGDVDLDLNVLNLKNKGAKDVRVVLEAYTETVEALVDFSPDALETAARAAAENHGWTTGEFFMVLRWATTGRLASPPLFETMSVLGRALVRRRLRRAMAAFKQGPDSRRDRPRAETKATVETALKAMATTATAGAPAKNATTAPDAGADADAEAEAEAKVKAKLAAKAARRALVEALRATRAIPEAAARLEIPVEEVEQRIHDFRVRPIEWQAPEPRG
ncbi:MAG: glutamate--tRNA ligase [Deltaproteobacteria bacterium]|nr:glutamate--tRNA ligase [Deltaproteobacteria bacterium]